VRKDRVDRLLPYSVMKGRRMKEEEEKKKRNRNTRKRKKVKPYSYF